MTFYFLPSATMKRPGKDIRAAKTVGSIAFAWKRCVCVNSLASTTAVSESFNCFHSVQGKGRFHSNLP